MIIELTEEQKDYQAGFRKFIEEEIAPRAEGFDEAREIPQEVLEKLAEQGYFGAVIPKEYGGLELDMVTYGLFCEQIGRASVSLLSLFTVHGMLSHVLVRWGTEKQKRKWLPKLANGTTFGAFAITEPEVGSDAASIQSQALLGESGDHYLLNGTKKWISGGQVADLFLIFAQLEGKASAFLVERGVEGLSTTPLNHLSGFRSAMLVEVHMEDCKIPVDDLVARAGFGFSHVANYALDLGRYSVAWGCVGIAQACLEASLDYTSKRKQFGVRLKKHQLIQKMIASMVTNVQAARLLSYNSGRVKDTGKSQSLIETSVAKYFSSKIANQAAADAVQIHGANGCCADYPVQRYSRDAQIMEIIEGSSQIQEIIIARYGYQNFS